MYNKNMRNNPAVVLLNFKHILTIAQILANSSTVEQNPSAHAKMLDFRQISESTETLSKPCSDKIKCFRNTFVLCIS